MFGQTLSAQFIAVGNYVGNGTSNRDVTDVGFTPDMVMIKGNSNSDPVVKTNTMAGALSRRITVNAPIENNRITALITDGFRLSNINTVNQSGVDYYWVAFKNTAGKVATGSYTGNGVDNRNISGVGFAPDYVMLIPESGQQSLMRFSSNSTGDVSYYFNATTAVSNRIQALQSDGFQVGTDPSSNENGTVYHYIAFKEDGTNIVVDKYTGDGDDNRFITTPINPIFLLIKAHTNRAPYQKIATLCGDAAFNFTNQDEYINNIQSFGNGGFEIGDDNSVNQNGTEYYYFTVQGGIRGIDCFALPIELVSFDGKQDDEGIHLEWVTASELNNDYFEVLRSPDGIHWNSIASIPGQGTTNQMHTYSWLDKTPLLAPESYYKLKQTDYSGESSFSKIIVFKTLHIGKEMSVYPNPFVSDLVISNLQTFPTQITMYNSNGFKIFEREITYKNYKMNLEDMPKGVYYVSLKNADINQILKVMKH